MAHVRNTSAPPVETIYTPPLGDSCVLQSLDGRRTTHPGPNIDCRQPCSSMSAGRSAAATRGSHRASEHRHDGRRQRQMETRHHSCGSVKPDLPGLHRHTEVPPATPRARRATRSETATQASNSMGRVVGPENSVSGFHGAGPVRRGFGIRAVMTRSDSASSIRARCAPRQ